MHFLNTTRDGAFLMARGSAFHSTAAAFGKDLSTQDLSRDFETLELKIHRYNIVYIEYYLGWYSKMS